MKAYILRSIICVAVYCFSFCLVGAAHADELKIKSLEQRSEEINTLIEEFKVKCERNRENSETFYNNQTAHDDQRDYVDVIFSKLGSNVSEYLKSNNVDIKNCKYPRIRLLIGKNGEILERSINQSSGCSKIDRAVIGEVDKIDKFSQLPKSVSECASKYTIIKTLIYSI